MRPIIAGLCSPDLLWGDARRLLAQAQEALVRLDNDFQLPVGSIMGIDLDDSHFILLQSWRRQFSALVGEGDEYANLAGRYAYIIGIERTNEDEVRLLVQWQGIQTNINDLDLDKLAFADLTPHNIARALVGLFASDVLFDSLWLEPFSTSVPSNPASQAPRFPLLVAQPGCTPAAGTIRAHMLDAHETILNRNHAANVISMYWRTAGQLEDAFGGLDVGTMVVGEFDVGAQNTELFEGKVLAVQDNIATIMYSDGDVRHGVDLRTELRNCRLYLPEFLPEGVQIRRYHRTRAQEAAALQ